MRTRFFLLAGSLLLATVATVMFVVAWFAIAAANLWVGVAKAGYSVGEELPIFALIFALPAAVAILLNWKIH